MDKQPLDSLPSLEALRQKIDASSTTESEAERTQTNRSSSAAIRIGADIVAGVGVGGFIGYHLDDYFGSIPLFLLCFTAFGLIAGIRMAMKTAEVAAGASDESE